MGLQAFLNPEEMKARSEKKRCVRQHMGHDFRVECSAVVVSVDVLAPLAAAGMLPHPLGCFFVLPASPSLRRVTYVSP